MATADRTLPSAGCRGGASAAARWHAVCLAFLVLAASLGLGCSEDNSVCQLDYHVFSLAASPDGKLIAAGGIMTTRVTIIDSQTMKPVTTLKTKGGPATSLAFSPDGRHLAAGVEVSVLELGLKVWDTATWKHVEGFELPKVAGRNTSTSLSVAFSPDGRFVAAANKSLKSGGVDLWEVETRRLVRSLPCEMSYVAAMAFSPDGKFIAAGELTWDTIEVWDVSAGTLVRTLGTRKKGTVVQLAYTRREGYLISALEEWHGGIHGGAVQVWDPDSGRLVRVLDWEPKDDQISGVCVAPDAGWLAASTQVSFVRLWDYRDGRELPILRGHPYKLLNAVACDANEKYVVAGGGKYVKIWRLE